jgi:catalase (peroxidase I)
MENSINQNEGSKGLFLDGGTAAKHQFSWSTQTSHEVFNKNPEVLAIDFFMNFLDLGSSFKSVSETDEVFEAHNRSAAELKVLVL